MHLKLTSLLILILLGSMTTSYCQTKLVIKPSLSIGFGFNHITNKQAADESFTSPKPGFTLLLNGRVEYHFNPKSYIELCVKGSEAAFSFGFGLKNVFDYIHQKSVETTQFNISYNRFLNKEKGLFKKLTNNNLFIRTKIGLGFGISPNRNKEYYNLYFKDEYFSENTSIASYWRNYSATPDRSIGIHVMGRIGFSFYKKKKELFDLILEYNQGLTNLTNIDLQYNINGTTYSALLGSRGTNVNITAGIPITLFRSK